MSVCVCVIALLIRNTKRIFSAQYYILICGLCLSLQYFCPRVINGTIFGYKVIERQLCVMILSATSV